MKRLLLLPLFITCFAGGAHAADTLNDKTIHAFYDKRSALILKQDKKGIAQLLSQRLADDILIKTHIVNTLDNNPPHGQDFTTAKSDYIGNVTKSFDVNKVDKYDEHITGIKYAPDRSAADVTFTMSSSGTGKVQINGALTTTHFKQDASCKQTFKLKNSNLVMTASNCDVKNVINRQVAGK